MPWAFTTVSATVNTTSTAGANATSTATVIVTGNYGISNALFADNSIGGSVGANTLGLRQSSGTTTAPTTPPVAGATFVNGTIVHTITGYTAGTRTITFNPVLTAAIANNASITLNPAVQIGAQVVVSDAVHSVTNVTNATNSVVTLFPQTGVAVPSIASGTSLTFYNPLLQSGTDTTIGTALAGLASFRSDIINAFIDNAGGYASGATSMVIDNGSGAAPAIAPTPTTTFLNSTRVHRVTSYDAGTRTITFSPALNASIANDAAITLFTPGVILNRGDGATGLDSYTVNSTRVRITGIFTMNAWAEQLVMAATCPVNPTGTTSLDVLAAINFAGTVNLNGARDNWGFGSGSICTSPIIVGNVEGSSSTLTFINVSSGSIHYNNSIIHSNSLINNGFGYTASITYTNAVFASTAGANVAGGNFIYIASSTINSLAIIGFRIFFLNFASNSVLSNLIFDSTSISTGDFNATYSNIITRNSNPSIIFKSDGGIGSAQSILLNASAGSNPGVAPFTLNGDGFVSNGGHLTIQKEVSHFVKDITGLVLPDVKIYANDTQNNQRFNWFTSGNNRPAYISSGVSISTSFSLLRVAGSTSLTSDWDGLSRRVYNWITNASGRSSTIAMTLAFASSPNRRSVAINCFANGAASAGASIINVDNNPGLFTNLQRDIGAPQINGYFVWNGTRHIITSVKAGGTVTAVAITSGGMNYTSAPTVSFSGGGATTQATATATVSGGVVTAITITWAGIGYTSAPTISFSGGGGSGAQASATVYTNNDYELGISPALTAQVPDNTALPVQNIWYDCRNKTRVTATIDHPSAGTYAVGAPQIVVDNGAGALLATTPVPYTNFIYAGEIYLITSVVSTSTEHALNISPSLRASIADNATITLENIPGSDFYDFRTASYPHLPQGQELNLAGTGTLTNTWTLLDDATITQTNKATVDGYSSLTTAAQVYDRAKSWWYDNFETLTASQQGAVLVSRSGTTLNAGSYNLTLATSGSVFAFSSNTITINAPTFTDTLTTTGTITLNNPSTTAINYASGIVPAGGTIALVVAGTYDLSGWTFASTGAARTIRNDSGGAVTVILRYDQIANITAANSQGSPLPSVKSKAVTFTGFPTANNANGVAPNPKFGLYSIANGWTFYDVSSGSVQVSLSEVGPESSFKAVTDAIGWIRPPEQTIQASRTDPFDWSDLYAEFTAEDGTAIIGAIPNPLPISYDANNSRFELASGEELTFAEVAATKEALTSSETGIQNFNTEALRAIQFVSNSAYKRIILPNTFTVAMQAGATAGAVLSDFLLLRRNQAGTAYADPFAHGLTSTAPGLTDRPEVVTAFQNNIFVGATATEIRSAVGLGSANLDSQLGDITALVL